MCARYGIAGLSYTACTVVCHSLRMFLVTSVRGILALGAVVHQANDDHLAWMCMHCLAVHKCDSCSYITSAKDLLMQVADRSELQTCVQTRSCTWA